MPRPRPASALRRWVRLAWFERFSDLTAWLATRLSRRPKQVARGRGQRPLLEALDERLAPGDTVGTMLAVSPFLHPIGPFGSILELIGRPGGSTQALPPEVGETPQPAADAASLAANTLFVALGGTGQTDAFRADAGSVEAGVDSRDAAPTPASGNPFQSVLADNGLSADLWGPFGGSSPAGSPGVGGVTPAGDTGSGGGGAANGGMAVVPPGSPSGGAAAGSLGGGNSTAELARLAGLSGNAPATTGSRPGTTATAAPAVRLPSTGLTFQPFVTQPIGDPGHPPPQQVATAVALSQSPSTSVAGQSVTFTATITAVNNTVPTSGTVTFKDGSVVLGTGSVNSLGQATFETSSLAVGNHSITAAYGGNAGYLASTSSSVNHKVNSANASLDIQILPSPAVYGEPATILASVSAQAPSTDSPTGQVQIYDNGTLEGTFPLNGAGEATYTTGSNLSPGEHTITVVYGGDGNFGSGSDIFVEDVQVPTTTTVAAQPAPSVYGQQLQLTAVVQEEPGFDVPGTATGVVSFSAAGVPLGSASLSGGVATLVTAQPIPIGNAAIVATYAGDEHFAASAGTTIQPIYQANTSTTLTVLTGSVVFGQPVTVTARVTADAPGQGLPTGTVVLYAGGAPVGVGSLDESGTATITTTAPIPVATPELSAIYQGDFNFKGSTGSAVVSVHPDSTTTTVAAPAGPSVYSQPVAFTATVHADAPGSGIPTGVAYFFDGDTLLGESPLIGGMAVLATAQLAPGSHAITATYGGDGNFTGGSAAPQPWTVVRDTTLVGVSSATNPSVTGQPVTLTAYVNAATPGIGLPVGTVDFLDGTTLLGQALLINGVATLTVSHLGVGSHSVTAYYPGDAGFEASTSVPLTQTVNSAATVTTVAVAPQPSAYGQALTLTATVAVTTPGSGVPTGAVVFTCGSLYLGTAWLDGSGVATTGSVAAPPAGSPVIVATYQGDGSFLGSVGSTTTSVTPDATTIAVTATLADGSSGPAVYGQAVTLTARLTAAAPGSGVPTGSVAFTAGAVTLGSATVDAAGVATLTTTLLPTGADTVTATYGGDSNYTGSSADTPQSVNKDTTTTTIVGTSSSSPDLRVGPGLPGGGGIRPNGTIVGSPAQYTVTVSANAPGSGVPTGTVTLWAVSPTDETLIGTGTLTNGTLTFVVTHFPFDGRIRADYAGSSNYFGSTGYTAAPAVDPTTTTVTASPNPAPYGQAVTLTATVSPTEGVTDTPTGSVAFYDGSTLLGVATLANGTATFTTTDPLAAGSHSITATYGGDDAGSFATSSGQTSLVVQAATGTTLAVSPQVAYFGQSVTLTATVTSTGGTPDGSVNFYDGSTLLATRTLSGGTASFTLTSPALGDHYLTASYSGSTDFGSSNSSASTLTVNPDPTATSLAASVGTTVYGQPVTLTATVSSSYGDPSGSVNFYAGSDLLGTAQLAGGTASLTVTTLLPGSYSLTASYATSGHFAGSTSSGTPLTVNADTTTVQLASSADPATYGQDLTFTATVSAGSAASGTPGGTVTFYDGNTALAEQTLSNGTATYTTASLAAGIHSISVYYSGDVGHTGSQSTGRSQRVEVPVTVTLAAAVAGPGVTLQVQVSSNYDVPLNGPVTIRDNGTDVGTVTLSGGRGTYSIATLAAGAHTFTAAYAGDSYSYAGTSNSVDVATTALALTFSANPAVFGQVEVITAALTSPGGTPLGAVNLYENNELLATAAATDGAATFALYGLAPGSHAYTVSYDGTTAPGATSYTGSSSSGTLTVNPASTTVQLAASADTVPYGQPVTFTATVTVDAPGAGTPSGEVQFYDNSTLLGAGALIDGTATFTTTTPLAGGPHAISASFAGDALFAGNSAYTNVTVLPGVSAQPLTTLEAVAFDGTIASLTGLVAGQQYQVQIDWGDGTAPDQSVYTASDTTGKLFGNHTYRTVPPGSIATVTVTVTDYYSGQNVTSQARATIQDQPWGITGVSQFVLVATDPYPASGPGVPVSVNVPFTGVLGYLWDYNPYWLPGDYRATVDYGDGSAPVSVPIVATLDPQGSGQLVGVIQGSHAYATAGTFPVTVTVSDVGTNTPNTLPDSVRVLTRPFAVNQFTATVQDTPAVFNLQAVEPDGDPVTYTLFSQPADGTVSLGDGGQVVYTPAPGFVGEDQFYFQARDGGLVSNLGLVQVHVAAPPPAGTDPGGDMPPPSDAPPAVALTDSLWVVHAGETVPLAATATDVLGAAGIVDTEWDFNYDGTTFVADPAGAGTLTPTYTFVDPGIYLVAVQVTNTLGQTAVDVGSVEVLDPTDPAPDGGVPEAQDPDPLGTGGDGGGAPVTPPVGPANPAFNPVAQVSNGSIAVGDSVVLSATAGAGVRASDQYVIWDFNYDGSNFNGQTVGQTVAHTFAAPGVYTVAADISDGEGDEQIVTQTVEVADVPTLVVVPPADREVDEGQPVTFGSPGAVDLVGNVDATSIQWDFNYDGNFNADPSAAGLTNPQHVYAVGNYVAAVQVSDDRGHTAIGLVNVQVDAMPPDVSAGTDLTVSAGEPVTFQGAADAYSAITLVDWDFNYDGTTFVADPAGAGTLTPTYTFVDPGTYEVALQVVDGDGQSNLDVITVTVIDTAPTGQVALSPVNPDGSAQGALTAGTPVSFAASNLFDVDPAVTPSVWADWDGDGNFSLVTPDQWRDVQSSAGGTSLLIQHAYDAAGNYTPVFRVEDAEGNYTESAVSLTVQDAAPAGTFGWRDDVHTIASTDTISFSNVSDPSPAATDAGFTYYYQLDDGGFQASDSPDFTVEGLDPGTTHTVQAYIQDAAGTQSPVYTQQVQVQGDVDLANTGSGSVQVDWVGQDGQSGSATVSAGQTYTFADEPASVSVTLLSSGATYDLSTNGSIDAIDGSGVTGVTLEVHTDDAEGLPDAIGDGHVGAITLGANSTVAISSRGDFGGLVGVGGGVVATTLEFGNLTGPISGVRHIDTLQAGGDVSDVTVADGIDNLEAYSLGDVTLATDPAGPTTQATVVVGPGGQSGTLDPGHQSVEVIGLDADDNVVSMMTYSKFRTI